MHLNFGSSLCARWVIRTHLSTSLPDLHMMEIGIYFPVIPIINSVLSSPHTFNQFAMFWHA